MIYCKIGYIIGKVRVR